MPDLILEHNHILHLPQTSHLKKHFKCDFDII
jgi:hypothetical protein